MTQHSVVVIGAGIVGAWIAHDLAATGVQVEVIDPEPGDGASSGNAGLLVPSYCLPLSNPATLRHALHNLRHGGARLARPVPWGWLVRFVAASRPGRAQRDAVVLQRLAEQSLERWGEFSGLVSPSGWTWLYPTERAAHAQLRASAALGVTAHVVPHGEPALTGTFVGLRFPGDSSVDPKNATSAVLARAVRRGARVRRTSVSAAARSGGEWRIGCADGSSADADHVVLAAGHQSRAVGRLFGLRLPVAAGHGSSLTMPAPPNLLSGPVLLTRDRVVLSPLPGGLRATGGMDIGGTGTVHRSLDQIRQVVRSVLPQLDPQEGVAWRGARPMTPGGLPLIGELAPGVLVATGHGTLGMTLAPSTAETIVRSVQQRAAS